MSEFAMWLPDDVAYILGAMKQAGFSAHVVGGSVRDSLIGRELGDFDITTNALPEARTVMCSIFRQCSPQWL